MNMDDIKRLCATVNDFVQEHDLRFKAKPVIHLEFADMGEFFRARQMLRRALAPEQIAQAAGAQRNLAESIEEIDVYGLTFRLRCDERVMTRDGPRGAAEVILGHDIEFGRIENPRHRSAEG